MVAKRFFYVCAGLFLLALSYHLGASRATAQAGSTIEGAAIDLSQNPFTEPPRASGVVGRTFYSMRGNGSTYVYSDPIPGTQRVIATEPNFIQVMLENGDVLQFNGTGWTLIGNVLGGAVGTKPETMGSLKARYR